METSPSSPPLPPANIPAIANVRTWCAFIHASALLGVLMHFPKLRFAIIESGASWVAWIMNAMDEAYVHHYTSVRDFEELDLLPSEYFKRQGHACFMFDPPALLNIPFTGSDCLMWGNDYPHREGGQHSKDVQYEKIARLGSDVVQRFFATNGSWLLTD